MACLAWCTALPGVDQGYFDTSVVNFSDGNSERLIQGIVARNEIALAAGSRAEINDEIESASVEHLRSSIPCPIDELRHGRNFTTGSERGAVRECVVCR